MVFVDCLQLWLELLLACSLSVWLLVNLNIFNYYNSWFMKTNNTNKVDKISDWLLPLTPVTPLSSPQVHPPDRLLRLIFQHLAAPRWPLHQLLHVSGCGDPSQRAHVANAAVSAASNHCLCYLGAGGSSAVLYPAGAWRWKNLGCTCCPVLPLGALRDL